jgi:predicted RNase H-like nuclease
MQIDNKAEMSAQNGPPAAHEPRASTRDRLSEHLAATAGKLLPLVELVERIRPHVENDSVFTSRREKIRAQLALVQQQLKADQPKHEALVLAFRALSEFVREEAREVSKDEVKESAKRLVLVTLKTAPDLIRAAHTAGLFS